MASMLLWACGDEPDTPAGPAQLLQPLALACAQGASSVFVADRDASAVVKITLDGSTRQRVSVGSWTGKGPMLFTPKALDVDAPGERAFVIDQASVIEVDLKTGARRMLSDFATHPGPQPEFPNDVHLTKREDQLLVADAELGLLSVDLGTGARRVLTPLRASLLPPDPHAKPRGMSVQDDTYVWVVELGVDSTLAAVDLGANANVLQRINLSTVGAAVDVAWLPSSGELLVLGGGSGADHGLTRVNPASGEELLVSGTTRGTGPAFYTPTAFCVDDQRQQAVVLDPNLKMLLLVELASGDRTALATW